MRISLKSNSSKTYTVYCVYWSRVNGKLLRYHSILEPDDGVGGFGVVSEADSNVIDSSMDGYFLSKDDKGMDKFVHKAAHPSEEFFFDLLDCGHMEKVEQLLQSMRDLGLDP